VGRRLASLRTAARPDIARLLGPLLRIADREVGGGGRPCLFAAPSSKDLAHQAADDAVVAILAKLDGFRGESRFTTWAYRFVMLEVS
jgi:RNA polymerase sigma-70 factor (ECF subfamily)